MISLTGVRMIGKFSAMLLGMYVWQACSIYEHAFDPSSSSAANAGRGVSNGSLKLNWHFPCDKDDADHTDGQSFYGEGYNWLNIQMLKRLRFQITGRACSSGYIRNTVFVFDNSGSMLENDPQINGSCARFRTLNVLAEKLYREELVKLGIVLFSDRAACLTLTDSGYTFTNDCLSADLIAAQDFKRIVDKHSEQLKADVCLSLTGTDYSEAFAAAEDLFSHSADSSGNELYFFSDGAPSSDPFDAIEDAERIKDYAFIATVGFGEHTWFLREKIASRVKDETAHRQANDIDELSTYFSELLDTNHATGKLEWERYGSHKEKGTVKLDDLIQDDGSFTVPLMNFDVSDPLDDNQPSGILMKFTIKPGFSKNSEYTIDADLRFE